MYALHMPRSRGGRVTGAVKEKTGNQVFAVASLRFRAKALDLPGDVSVRVGPAGRLRTRAGSTFQHASLGI